MMQLSFICPTSYLEYLDKYQDNYLLLAHIGLVDVQYREFFKQNSKYKIMDNSAHELGESVDFNRIIDLALELDCQELVLPDKLYDYDATVMKTEEAIELLRRRGLLGRFKLMAVVQGSNYATYMKCLTRFMGNPHINVLGAGFWIVANAFKPFSGEEEVMPNRLMFSREMASGFFSDIYFQKTKTIHLLGLGDCLELKYQKQYSFIRSNDSAAAVKYGMAGQLFDPAKGRGPRLKIDLDFTAKFDHTSAINAEHNICVMKGLVNV